MNEIRVAELIEFNQGYYAGQSKSILYRCSLVGPFVFDICQEQEEETLAKLLIEWFDICDTYNLDLVESLIEVYTDEKIQGQHLSLYEQFPEYFERLVDFLLGKVSWTPDNDNHIVAEDLSTNLTAQLLTDIYSK